MAEKDISGLLKAINSGDKDYPVISAVKSNPVLAAAVSKLKQPRENRIGNIEDESSYSRTLPRTEFYNLSNNIARRNKDNETVLELFPETELAAQILISSIISPKDMTGSELLYQNELSFLPPELTSTLVKEVKDYIKRFYSLESELSDILREVLFTNGSYITAVVPESNVDRLINGPSTFSLESLNNIYNTETKKIKGIGILGSNISQSNSSLESLFINKNISIEEQSLLDGLDLITITDNYEILKLPLIAKKATRDIIKSKVRSRVSVESRNIANANKYGLKEFINYSLAKPNRESVGKPLVMKLPSEAVIPVHVPGDPKDHVGYFVLLDGNGHPIITKPSHYAQNTLEAQLNDSNNSMSSFLLEKARLNTQGIKTDQPIRDIEKVFSELVEANLISRLRNGVYSEELSISETNSIYRTMLARVLEGQYTKILYLPKEVVSYIAYKYHDNGVGKSLLDSMATLNSLRAMTMFSRVIAGIKNSIGITQVKLKLDERDPDPNKSIEIAMSEIIKTRQQAFPLGINTPSDLVDWVQRSSLEFTFEGHPKIPDMNFEFNQMGSSHIKPDTELEEELNKRATMALGLTPEIIDNSLSPEFATAVTANNVLLSKRVIRIQEVILPQLSNLIRLLIESDDEFISLLEEHILKYREKLKEVIEREYEVDPQDASIYKIIAQDFINTITVDLPRPDNVDLQNQSQAFDQYIELVEKTLDYWISSNLINSTVAGEVADNIDAIKEVVKAYYIRRWMGENNVLPEFNDMISMDQDGNSMIDLFEIQKTHLEGITRSAIKFIDSMTTMKDAATADLQTLSPDEFSASSDSTTSDSSESADSGSSGDDFGGDLDMGFDTDQTDEVQSEEISEETVEEKTESDVVEETPANQETDNV